ncbi:hypothetical protein BC830DRAFT_788645 [Chytriomyces sp. MP71]|nr:hypothetical protein BC830DRAFT_788645 [Chytriomyces sp. MP71]
MLPRRQLRLRPAVLSTVGHCLTSLRCRCRAKHNNAALARVVARCRELFLGMNQASSMAPKLRSPAVSSAVEACLLSLSRNLADLNGFLRKLLKSTVNLRYLDCALQHLYKKDYKTMNAPCIEARRSCGAFSVYILIYVSSSGTSKRSYKLLKWLGADVYRTRQDCLWRASQTTSWSAAKAIATKLRPADGFLPLGRLDMGPCHCS